MDRLLTIDQHPQQFNPQQGWIATANHNILPPGYPFFLSSNFALPFRFERIAEVLAAQPKHTVEDSRALQQDVTSVAARRFVHTVGKSHEVLTGHAAEMAAEFTKWDGVLPEDSLATTYYAFWQDACYASAFSFKGRPSLEVLLKYLEQDDGAGKALQSAADQAWTRLTRQYGADSKNWQWGRIHKLTLGSLPSVSRPGDANTPNATGGAFPSQTSGASFREVLDLADWDRSISTNVPGESGNPASPHYSDLLLPWSKGEYHPLAFSRAAVEKVTTERLTLK